MMFLRYEGALMRSSSYSEQIFSTCGKFSVLTKLFMIPLTEQGLLTKQREELTGISIDMGLKDKSTSVPLINIRADMKEVSTRFKHSCEDGTSILVYSLLDVARTMTEC
jgi:hypothetical protein